jgi:hypothetical protein
MEISQARRHFYGSARIRDRGILELHGYRSMGERISDQPDKV